MKTILRRVVEYSGTGRWIYTRTVLSWAQDASLVTQLPPRLRLFCKFVAMYNRFVGTRTIVFAHGVYRLLGVGRERRQKQSMTIRGCKIWLDFSDPGALSAINEIHNGSAVAEEIKSLCRDASLFVDVGANQGAMTVIAGKALPQSAMIVAIEPQSNLAACIEDTLRESRPGGNWLVARTAVGSRTSTARIAVPRENFGEAHISDFHDEATQASEAISVTTIDDLLASIELPADVVMKMDIEGFETEALSGAGEFIRKFKPKLIMEINPAALARYRSSVQDLGRLLGSYGYLFWRECGKPGSYHRIDDLPLSYCDIVLSMDNQPER